jgi:TPR repeat protein
MAAAQHDLATMYADGTGVPRDSAEAVEWYRKAAAQADTDARDALDQMIRQGRGVTMPPAGK